MEIFYNSERPGYDEIVSYGPKWWTEYREMDANYRFAGWTLDLMAYYLERVVKNQFPSQADEETIAMFEKLLHIESDVELSLEERRRIVSAYYSGSGHLSRSVILTLVKAYTGQDGDVYWNNGVLCIEFNNDEGMFVSIGLLQKVIERRIPAHIPFKTRCTRRVKLGISVAFDKWEKRFTLAGTKPKTSTGLCIANDGILIETATEAFRSQSPMTGDNAKAGTYPEISTGLKITDEGISVDVHGEAYEKEYPMSGNSGEAGMHPKESVGLNVNGESVLPEISTESWSVSYQLCGDAFEI